MHHFKSWHMGFYAFGGLNIVMGLLYVSKFLCGLGVWAVSQAAPKIFISND